MPSARELRRQLAGLTGLAARDLDALWRSLDAAALNGGALFDLLPALVEKYGAAAAAAAADWYDELRDERLIRGRFQAIPADIPNSGVEPLIGWATATATDDASLQAMVLGGTTRRILNYGRQTVMGSSIADPRARGWMRVGDGATCEFCAMLLDRGAVYSEDSADFPAHDHCGCTASPAWD